MLQKATGGGHSWWWASHIRTKQSKWLELNLQDMDAKVDHVLNLIQKDGDSFARRADMYYKHRPDVISFIEETLRAYRALGERYDKLSGDLQKANTTIASICPEKVDLSLDEDDDDFSNYSPRTPKLNRQNRIKTPKAPKPVNKDVNRVLDNASQTIEAAKTNKEEELENQNPPKSGLTKDDALQEIDNLQKQIFEMETMKDSMKNYYENSLAEYWDAQTQIIENQQRISRLEDEYEISKKIEEDDKGTLMAEEALKSCQETLAMLQDQQKKLRYDVKLEHQRFDQAKQKLKSIKQKYSSDPDVKQEQQQQVEIRNVSNQNMEGVSKNPEKITELADTIDTLVNMVITLESSISSQTVLADMLRKEADDLQSQIRTMEVDMQTQAQKFETDLQSQTQKMEDELQTQIQKIEDDLQSQIQKIEDDLQIRIHKMEDELQTERDHTCVCNETVVESKSEEKKIDISWQAMLLNETEDKDKIILEEYITILRRYKDTKKKLSEEQKINQGLKQKLRLVKENIPHEDESNTTIDEEAQAFSAMDVILDENVNFWLKFSTAFHQVYKFKTQIEDLNEEIKKVNSRSDIKVIYKSLKDIKSRLTIWLEESTLLKDELKTRFAYLSNIEEGIKFSSHEEAVKFQGEIMKKKEEHNKVSEELEASLDNVVAIKLELEKTLERVGKEYGLLKNHKHQEKGKLSSSRSIIPLTSFLFGVKTNSQKSSFFSCMSSPKKSKSKKGGCMSL